MERASDPALPLWLRVAALAFGRHRLNGHANFAMGELGKLLGKPGPDGKPKPISNSAVANAISKAKKHGFIAEDSMARCLVVPRHAVTLGVGGSVHTKCCLH
ncbi:hypothetical protein [Mycobacterium sp. Root265]|uniref:hypothetical protein n=1 Tax=Mycobacterium sp. Root265 TaxID=1736504 RepID=UPI0012E34C37|nr:hypothetical protein [Mycobacterium sp. Root265]